MRGVAKCAAFIVGCALIGAALHQSIEMSGGYSWTTSPLVILIGAGIVVGAVAIGVCLDERRRGVACLLILALVAAEAYTLILTAERTMRQRELTQVPLREAQEARQAAVERLSEAEAALGSWTMSDRLRRALESMRRIEDNAAQTSAQRHCGRNCRQVLEAQIESARAEVEAARGAHAVERERLSTAVDHARADLAELPAPPSPTPLADRLGLDPWQIDLALAMTASLAANGLAAFLIAFAAHGRRREPIRAISPALPAVERIPPALTSRWAGRDPTAEADKFLAALFRPSDEGRVPLIDVRDAYRRWCQTTGREPLPDADFGSGLIDIIDAAGLDVVGEGQELAVVGIERVAEMQQAHI